MDWNQLGSGVMKVSEAEAKRLLAAVKKASERSRRAHEASISTAQERAAAVRAAMDAGIPRDEIAEAAGVKRTGLYRLTEISK